MGTLALRHSSFRLHLAGLLVATLSLIGGAQAQSFPTAELEEWVWAVAYWEREYTEWYAVVITSSTFQRGDRLSPTSLPGQATEARRLANEALDLMNRGGSLVDELYTLQGHPTFDDLALAGTNRVLPRVNALSKAVRPVLAMSTEGIDALEFEFRTDIVALWMQIAGLRDRLNR